MNPDTFIGVDVSKGWLDYAITDKQRKSMLKLKTDNNLAGFRKLVKEMRAAGYILGKKAWKDPNNLIVFRNSLPICVCSQSWRNRWGMWLRRSRAHQKVIC